MEKLFEAFYLEYSRASKLENTYASFRLRDELRNFSPHSKVWEVIIDEDLVEVYDRSELYRLGRILR